MILALCSRRLAWGLVGLLGLAAGGCPGEMMPRDRGVSETGPRPPDARLTPPEGPARYDLPITPNVPCLSGACGPNLICMANICLKMCTQPMPGCNDKVATCATNEACMGASSFTDACYPAAASSNQACDYEKALYCAQGNLCVRVGSASPRCLKLCKYGCSATSFCGKTDNGCEVCIPR